jgi:hypothetical protein
MCHSFGKGKSVDSSIVLLCIWDHSCWCRLVSYLCCSIFVTRTKVLGRLSGPGAGAMCEMLSRPVSRGAGGV